MKIARLTKFGLIAFIVLMVIGLFIYLRPDRVVPGLIAYGVQNTENTIHERQLIRCINNSGVKQVTAMGAQFDSGEVYAYIMFLGHEAADMIGIQQVVKCALPYHWKDLVIVDHNFIEVTTVDDRASHVEVFTYAFIVVSPNAAIDLANAQTGESFVFILQSEIVAGICYYQNVSAYRAPTKKSNLNGDPRLALRRWRAFKAREVIPNTAAPQPVQPVSPPTIDGLNG